ncbi:DUF305 domain-containing protein [Nocardia stercoris]|uniref:DUF305 domain-containing protein n=1 Tax=Nocardia stercoris TaxID=2483361 RepID=A0A3M2L1T6_9NOCA|nr:DUF305 domain-containing protein [Nocardia stercoris]RMI31662.1 DUF305 domain-containing protein [Nocardia stercoris]
MAADATAAVPEPDPVAGALRRKRLLMAALALIAVLCTGIAIGLMLRVPLQDSSAAPNAVDVGFCQDMSIHHTQAVQMSAFEFAGGSDPDVKRLAYDIMTTQANQAGRMQGWLQQWNKPVAAVGGYMGWMTVPMSGHDMSGMSGTGTHPVPRMPGMASDAEMEQLQKLTGPAQDTLFLQLMLRHHQGGLPMITDATDHADTDVVRSLAASMAKTQAGEMQTMTQMLTQRGAAPLPMN